MRTATNEGVTLKYPDAVGFAFNPCLLIATGDDVQKLHITLSDEAGNSQELFLDAFNGVCYADLREYVQTFFDTMAFGVVNYSEAERTAMGVNLDIMVDVYDSEDNTLSFEFETFYIWAALKIGGQDVYNGERTLTWFRGFPFTFGVYAAGGGSILFGRDGVATKFINLDEQGVWNVPLLEDSDTAKKYYTISDCTGAFQEVTFDSTFDLTFRYVGGGTKTERLRINIVDDYDEGYYLRWIDRHGFYVYYLFKAGEVQTKVTSDEVFMRNNLLAYDMTYGYEGYTGRQQQMSREDVVPVCAPLVDSDTFDMLLDIATSPCVDLFSGYDSDGTPRWVSVTAVAGSYTKSGATLQDFICHLTLPEVPIQKL